MADLKRQTQVSAVFYHFYRFTTSKNYWQVVNSKIRFFAVKCQVKEVCDHVIKWLIHFPLLSLDTSLHKPDSAIYNLSATFEREKWRKA